MDGGKPNIPSLREEIANILPQKKEAGSAPTPASSASPRPAPAPVLRPTPEEKPDTSQKYVLRTMPSDLETLKKGQAPSGFNVETSGKTTPRPSHEIPTTPPPKVELGAKEKAAPMAPPTAMPKPKIDLPVQLPPKVERPKAAPPPAAAEPKAPPKKKGGSLKIIIAALVFAIVAFGIIWSVFIREAEEPALSPTPTLTPTTSPEGLGEIFGIPGSFVIASDQFDPMAELLDSIGGQLVGLNETKAFVIIDERGEKYSLSQVLELLEINMPLSLEAAIDLDEYVLVVYGQTEEYDSQGNLVVTSGSAARFKRIGVVVKVDDVIDAENTMLAWEDTMVGSVRQFFGLEDRAASAGTFGDNTYNGVSVRFLNFPNPDLSIDYAFPSSSTGDNYLVLTNSRESLYSSVDKLLGFLGE